MSNLKVIIITQGLSQIVHPIVNSYNVVGIVESAPRKAEKHKKNLFYKIGKVIYRAINHKTETLKSFCESKCIPYYFMEKGSDKNLESWLRERTPDLIVVYLMSHLLKRNIFETPKYGTLNLHPSLLPNYKGPNPWFWMYYNMDKIGGVTVHYIDDGEDTGDIIYQKIYKIPLGIKLSEFQDFAIKRIGLQLLIKAINNILNGTVKRTPQPKTSRTMRARNIKSDEHRHIIKWHEWTIEHIWHVLRGTQDWLKCIEQPKGIFNGQQWEIGNLNKCMMSNYQLGKIYKENGNYFVACKDGKIYISLKFCFKKFILNVF